MKRVLFYLLLAITLSSGFQSVYCSEARAAESVDSWKVDFDTLCGQTDNAAEMSLEELKKALERCDALKPKIEALEATPRKVYLKRLLMCRNLFAYLLEGKEKK
jgi:hypothetical protein